MNLHRVLRILGVAVLVGFLFIQPTVRAQDFGKQRISEDLPIEEYGNYWDQYNREISKAQNEFSGECRKIRDNTPAGPQRDKLLQEAQNQYRARSQELARNVRDPIHRRLIKEINKGATGTKGETSSGARQTSGTDVNSDGFRGHEGDLDLGSGARSADNVGKVLKKMKINAPVNTRGGTVDVGGGFNLTINKEGPMGKPGTSGHQAQVGVDARNPETYVSETMADGQPGRDAVRCQDHIKKALNGSPTKGAQKCVEDRFISDRELLDIMRANNINGTPREFRERLANAKQGKGGVPEADAANFDQACQDIMNKSVANTQAKAKGEMAEAKSELDSLQGKTDPASMKRARELRDQLADSNARLNETKAANAEARANPDAVRKQWHDTPTDAAGKAGETGGSGQATETAGKSGGKGVGESTGAGKAGGMATDTAGGAGSKGAGEATLGGSRSTAQTSLGGSKGGGGTDVAGAPSGSKGATAGGETTGGGTTSGKGGGSSVADTLGPTGGSTTTGKSGGHKAGGVSEGGAGGGSSGETGGAGESSVADSGAGEPEGTGESRGGMGESRGGSEGGSRVTDAAPTGSKGASAGEGTVAGKTSGRTASTEPTRVTETPGSPAGETAGTGERVSSGEPAGEGAPRVTESGRGASAPEGPGLAGKGLKAAGDAMEVVAVINQAGKVHEGLKEGDINKVAAGVAGEDAAKTAQAEGAKGYADDMDNLQNAKAAEARAAAVGKLKRMGATDAELRDYQNNYDSNPGKAREVVRGVQARGGKDMAPQKGLEGAGPEESSWNLKDQLTDGAKQAGSYAHAGADMLTLGGLSHVENAVNDVNDVGKSADAVEQGAKAEQLSKLYTDLRARGATRDEANKALQNYGKDPTAFRQLVKELRERDPDKFNSAVGKHGKNLGTGGNIDMTSDDTAGDRATAKAGELKGELVDKPANVVGGIIGDITGDNQETEGILAGAAQRTKEGAATRDQIYKDLIAKGAKESEARAAVNDLARGNRDTLRGLVSDLRGQDEANNKPFTGATAGASAGDKGMFGPKEPVTSDSSAFEGIEAEGDSEAVTDTGEPVPWGARNDAGETVDAGTYEGGDRIINKDGVEFVNQDGQWVETGDNYGAYDPSKDTGPTTEAVSTPSIPDTGLNEAGEPIVQEGESQPADQGEPVASGDDEEAESDESVQSDDEQDPDDTGDVADNSGRDDSESEDGEVDVANNDESSDDLADSEAGMPDMEQGDVDSSDKDEGGILDGYTGDREDDAGERGQAGLDTMDNVTQVAKASTAGDQQVAAANHIISDAGDDYNTSRGQSSSDVAAGDREDSWGNTMGNSLQQGLEQGLSQAATAVGAAAADQVSGQIFDKGKPDHSPEGGEGNEGDSGEVSSGAATADGSGGGGGGGGGCTDGDNGAGQGGGGSGSPPPSPPPPPQPPSGGAKSICAKCWNCGAVVDLAKEANAGKCPRCGFRKLVASTPQMDTYDWASPCACPSSPAPAVVQSPPPATQPAPPEPPKGWKCPVCGSYDTKFELTSPLYGDVYHCNGCGGTVHNVW
jgi:DNA-directed RNA polymerase subunit RPC12/RpoP